MPAGLLPSETLMQSIALPAQAGVEEVRVVGEEGEVCAQPTATWSHTTMAGYGKGGEPTSHAVEVRNVSDEPGVRNEGKSNNTPVDAEGSPMRSTWSNATASMLRR